MYCVGGMNKPEFWVDACFVSKSSGFDGGFFNGHINCGDLREIKVKINRWFILVIPGGDGFIFENIR